MLQRCQRMNSTSGLNRKDKLTRMTNSMFGVEKREDKALDARRAGVYTQASVELLPRRGSMGMLFSFDIQNWIHVSGVAIAG